VKFIDLFSGCGGLSLGLSLAGMEGVFAIEKDAMAFETFQANFLDAGDKQAQQFSWPAWLKVGAWSIDGLLREHSPNLASLRGKVDVIAGGPPCQGFSFAGRRNEDDPRNKLFKKYVDVVKLVKPKALIVENVPGMAVIHNEMNLKPGSRKKSFFEKLTQALKDLEYDVAGVILDPVKFGVPQKRSRLIVVGIRNDLAEAIPSLGDEIGYSGGVSRVFRILKHDHERLVKGLGFSTPVSAAEAISDLEIARGRVTQECIDPRSPKGFQEVVYAGPETDYQRFMNAGHFGTRIDSTRLARHREHVTERLQQILDECQKGTRMNEVDRKRFGLNKHRVCPLHGDLPSLTVTTLPDDIIHYSEPRILTVRECARLQSFPDWFEFRGKFTTGGDRRTKECPRYTQVGNAVPPLLGRAIGLAVVEALSVAELNIKRGAVSRSGGLGDFRLAA
jgi:DNA (cytosine-5)-methyltransferase 1